MTLSELPREYILHLKQLNPEQNIFQSDIYAASTHFPATFLPLLLFLTYADVAYATKIEDILTCLNDTDCDESIDDSALHTPNSEVDDSASRDASNYTEEDGLYVTTASMEITTSSKMNTSVTERPQSTAATTTSPATTVTPRDDETILTLEKKEICECDLTVRISCLIHYGFTIVKWIA